MIFYLGVHRPPWLRLMYEKLPFEKKPRAVPLFLSYSTLGSLGRLPRAVSRWALDSGAYTELTHHGQWRIGARAYAAGVQRIRTAVGNMDWAGPQDWTCDKKSLAMSGLTVLDHQKRTTRNLLDLWNLGAPVIPVLQGWTADDYERHIEAYGKAGVDLHSAPLVGVGSVAGRQQTKFTWDLLAMLKARYGLRIHAFGLKRVGLINSARYIASADSMGWSGEARRERASDPARRGHEGPGWQQCPATCPTRSGAVFCTKEAGHEGEHHGFRKRWTALPKMPGNWGRKWAENEAKKAILR